MFFSFLVRSPVPKPKVWVDEQVKERSDFVPEDPPTQRTPFGVLFALVRSFLACRQDGFKLRLTDSFSARRDSRATQQFTGLLRLTPSSEDPQCYTPKWVVFVVGEIFPCLSAGRLQTSSYRLVFSSQGLSGYATIHRIVRLTPSSEDPQC